MAPRHRPLWQTPQPAVPYLPPAGRHDPRGFGMPYDGTRQPDQVQRMAVADAVAAGLVSFEDVLNDLTAHNLPPQLLESSFLVQIPAVGVAGAQLLIPKNPTRRMSFSVSNFLQRNNVLFSFDKPICVGDLNGAGSNTGAGIPIGLYYQETNGAVSVNDIWVFCNDPAEIYTSFFILGYEGGIALTGNKL
jgi:hypothetical protein